MGARATAGDSISITDKATMSPDQPDPLGDTREAQDRYYFWFKASGKKQTSKTNKTIDIKQIWLWWRWTYDASSGIQTATTSKAKANFRLLGGGTSKDPGVTDYIQRILVL